MVELRNCAIPHTTTHVIVFHASEKHSELSKTKMRAKYCTFGQVWVNNTCDQYKRAGGGRHPLVQRISGRAA